MTINNGSMSFLRRKIVRPLLQYIRLRLDIVCYSIRLSKILKNKQKKEKLKVVFFPINIGMWKNDHLFKLLQNDSRYDPYVISFFVPVDNPDFQRRNQEEMRTFFTNKGYPYYDMYDYEKNEWFNIESFQPDVVFYTQAVNVSYKRYNIQSLWNNCLFYYIPYCLLMEQETITDNTLLFNISMKVFAPSEFHKKYWSGFINRGKNVVVTGYPSFDYLLDNSNVSCSKWKCNDGRKRVIWAPHHSITNNDLLSYSNFLEIADSMVELAEKYQDKMEFVFKPHPRLRPKLEQMDGWGVERTGEYYNKWTKMPNTNFVDGNYFDLFLTSDAMIHDCSTFMAEYLLTGKPVMFNMRDDSAMNLNEYAKRCFQQHYIGRSLQDVEEFLNEIVLSGSDPMKSQRLEFVEKELKVGYQSSVAGSIYSEIKKDLG